MKRRCDVINELVVGVGQVDKALIRNERETECIYIRVRNIKHRDFMVN